MGTAPEALCNLAGSVTAPYPPYSKFAAPRNDGGEVVYVFNGPPAFFQALIPPLM